MKEEFVTIPLRDVTIAQKGVKPIVLRKTKFESAAVPYLDIQALETGNVREYTLPQLGTLCSEDDLLVVWDGSRSGLALKGQYGAVGSTLMKLTPIALDVDYLFYFIKTNYNFLNRNLTGGGIPHVNSDIFFELKIPYIPIENQRQVVEELLRSVTENKIILKEQNEIISNLLVEAGADVVEKSDIKEVIKRFRRSVLDQAVSGKLTEGWRSKNNVTKGYDLTTLGSVILEIKSGKSFRCLERPPGSTEVGVIKISAVSGYKYMEEESKTCIDQDKINPELFIKSGDFLLTRANTKELVGACAIVNETTRRIMLSDKILRITFDNTKAIDEFILLFLQSKDGRFQIENFATGSQESMKNITQNEIRSIQLELPSIAEQIEVVRISKSLLATIDKIENQYIESVLTFEKLEAAILTQAYSEAKLNRYQKGLSFEKLELLLKQTKDEYEQKNNEMKKSRQKERRIVKQEIAKAPTLDIEELLMKGEQPMPAKEVWKKSRYSNDIDAFFEAVKLKVGKSITWELVDSDQAEPFSIISIKRQA